MDKINLSVIILTRNEEANIKDCIESVKDWVSEIIIVDDYSVDKTLEIARSYTDKIYQRKWEMEGTQRNFAYSKASNDYILSVDADERISPQLKDEIIGIFLNGPKYEGYNIPHRNYLGDYWIRRGGWYPNAKLKMFKKDNFRYEDSEYHPRAFLKGKTYTLKGDIIHYNYPDFHSLFSKINHQTYFEAKKWIRDGRKMNLGIVFRKSLERFFKFYFIKGGFLDGFIGFSLAINSGLYQFYTYCKYWEIKKNIKIQSNVQK